MRIDCIGAGPAALYFAALAKQRRPNARIRIFERAAATQLPGWGVVVDDDLRGRLRSADAVSAARIESELERWDTLEVQHRGHRVLSYGHNYGSLSRRRLLKILRARCVELGVELNFDHPVVEPFDQDADLVVGSDGVNSVARTYTQSALGAKITIGANCYLWCGTPYRFENFAFIFVETPHGWIWSQAYRFDAIWSTFIIEARPETLTGLGLIDQPTEAALAALFAPALHGAPLILSGQSVGTPKWSRFIRVECREWHHQNLVLIGDAAHTAHFSIGSGTKLALEDAVALADSLFSDDTLPLSQRLKSYQAWRQPQVAAIQRKADCSNEWFESFEELTNLPPEQFAYLLLTRSQPANRNLPAARLAKMVAIMRGKYGGPNMRGGVDKLRLSVL
jgi:anthraniloyl-CoA monooxygenase